jgi:hypothetical protein
MGHASAWYAGRQAPSVVIRRVYRELSGRIGEAEHQPRHSGARAFPCRV